MKHWNIGFEPSQDGKIYAGFVESGPGGSIAVEIDGAEYQFLPSGVVRIEHREWWAQAETCTQAALYWFMARCGFSEDGKYGYELKDEEE